MFYSNFLINKLNFPKIPRFGKDSTVLIKVKPEATRFIYWFASGFARK
jgi:hypothetical protein